MKPNLDEIEARCKAVTTGEYQGSFVATAQMVLRQDIPALLAYCRELQAAIADYADTVGLMEGVDYINQMPEGRSREIIETLGGESHD